MGCMWYAMRVGERASDEDHRHDSFSQVNLPSFAFIRTRKHPLHARLLLFPGDARRGGPRGVVWGEPTVEDSGGVVSPPTQHVIRRPQKCEFDAPHILHCVHHLRHRAKRDARLVIS